MSSYFTNNNRNNNGSGVSKWAVLAGVGAAIAATGYLVYGYSTGWQGPAYSLLWCPNRRKQKRKVKSPFYAQVDQHSDSLEVDARAWMERYVQTALIKSTSSHQKWQASSAKK